MITIQQEAWADCVKEILPIWQGAHAAETVDWEKDRQLDVNPNLTMMHQLADLQMLITFTVRDDAWLIGYAVVLVSPDFSCSHLLMCNVMLHYLCPKYRGVGTGAKLFQAVQEYAQSIHADGIMAGNKAHLDHGKRFERIGYHAYGTTYLKWLKYETETQNSPQT
jgi:L-amino acid N-acyltransferase YncA